MKTISSALQTHLGTALRTTCTLWKVTLANGTVIGFTDFAQDINYNGVTYQAQSGATPSSISTNEKMSVDNLELMGFLESPSITDQALMAGTWDYALVQIYLVNYNDLSMGTLLLKQGYLGEIKTGRHNYTAELRGLTQVLQQSIGYTMGELCNADLGDSRCQVVMSNFQKSGSITSVTNGRAFKDSTRTESQAPTVLYVTNITQANPAVVTTSATCPFGTGEQVLFQNIQGMTELNGYTFYVETIDSTHFSIEIDSRHLTGFTGGVVGTSAGTVQDQPMGWWDYGKLTFTSGQNNGVSKEVRSCDSTGNFMMQEYFPLPVAVGDTYTITPGCSKLVDTCRSKYNNVINFRGFPFIPGQDKLFNPNA